MSGHDDALRERLADALHDAIDGDFLVGAGMRVSNEDMDVPLSEVSVKEVVAWAVRALLPVLADVRAEAAREARWGTWQALHDDLCTMRDWSGQCAVHENPHRADRIGGEQR